MTQVRLQFNTFYFVCCLPTLAFRLMPLWVQCLLFMYGIQKCQSYRGASATLTLNLSAREQVRGLPHGEGYFAMQASPGSNHAKLSLQTYILPFLSTRTVRTKSA